MKNNQCFKFLLVGVPPKPHQASSTNQTQTSVDVSSTMEYLGRHPNLLYKLFGTQNQSKKAQKEFESEVSTELSLSCCFNSDQKRDKPYVVSNKRKSCPNPHETVIKRMRGSGRNPEEMEWGYSIELKLYDDPWKIKKFLTESDLGNLSRLLLATDLVKKLVLPVLGVDPQIDTMILEKRLNISFWDVDTGSMHHLILKYWVSSKSYVFLGSWNQDFVKRRKKEDEIGLHWDPYKHHFNLSVLKCGC